MPGPPFACSMFCHFLSYIIVLRGVYYSMKEHFYQDAVFEHDAPIPLQSFWLDLFVYHSVNNLQASFVLKPLQEVWQGGGDCKSANCHWKRCSPKITKQSLWKRTVQAEAIGAKDKGVQQNPTGHSSRTKLPSQTSKKSKKLRKARKNVNEAKRTTLLENSGLSCFDDIFGNRLHSGIQVLHSLSKGRQMTIFSTAGCPSWYSTKVGTKCTLHCLHIYRPVWSTKDVVLTNYLTLMMWSS